jgi:hypothetical protein
MNLLDDGRKNFFDWDDGVILVTVVILSIIQVIRSAGRFVKKNDVPSSV